MQYQITDLGQGGAKGINNNGQVIFDYNDRIYYWENGVSERVVSASGYNEYISRDINELGQVTGFVRVKGTSTYRPFVYDRSTNTTTLRQIPSWSYSSIGYGINDNGDIAGWSPGGGAKATIWYGNTPVNVGVPSGSTYSVAYDINNNGYLLGAGYEANSGWYRFKGFI